MSRKAPRVSTGAVLVLGLIALFSATSTGPRAEDAAPPTAAAASTTEAPSSEAKPAEATPSSPVADHIARLVKEALPETASDEERKEQSALEAFYAARSFAPLWVGDKGFNEKAEGLIAELGRAANFGLDPKDVTPPTLASGEAASPDKSAAAEVGLMHAALKYARFARGGRILAPSEQLNSHLDRRPQFIDPKIVLDDLAAAVEPGEILAKTNPQHAQFQRLREKYMELLDKSASKPLDKKAAAERDRLLANMEMWRWMAPDLGDMYMMANVPEFMIRLVKAGEVIHTERVVAGEVGKQTSIFSRPLKNIALRPAWRVPESIKVHELWPSLLRGGGLFRQYGLELQTKEGKSLDYRSIDWKKDDIRNYEVVQPPGPKSVLGVVKFSFPSQHTIFMHDTPDKWMFGSKQRTLSHGCLRLRNPLKMAELILAEDKGWDRAKIDEEIRTGPLNNEVVIEKKIRMHIVYFTAWVDDTGRLVTYPDVYGHEKRVRLALAGRWSEIDKGVDHLAPVEPGKAVAQAKNAPEAAPAAAPRSKTSSANDDFVSSFFGAVQ